MSEEEQPVSTATAEGDESRPQSRSVKGFLETAGKIFVGIAGLCYVTGLMVMAVHLNRYGLNSLVLSQLNYVMAGVWTLLPIVLAIFLTSGAFNAAFLEMEKAEERGAEHSEGQSGNRIRKSGAGFLGRWFSRRNRQIASSVFGTLFAMAFGLGMVLQYTGINLGWSWLLLLPAGSIVGFFVIGLAYVLARPRFPDVKSVVGTMSAAFFVLLAFLGYVILFARFSYRDIPWSVGGGRPSLVRLVVAADSKPYLESAQIPFSPQNQLETEPLQLLLVTDKEYVILSLSGEGAVTVRADLVKAIKYEKR